VPQDKTSGKTSSLAKQGAPAGTQEKKKGLPLTEERKGLKRSTGISLDHAERKLERQNSS